MEVFSVPIAVAAKIMGKGEDFVKAGLRQGKLPIGVAYQINGSTYNYYISPALLMLFTGCTEKDIKDAARGDSHAE